MENRQCVSVYLRPALLQRIEAAAKADGRSLSNFIERALEAVMPHELDYQVAFPTEAQLETLGRVKRKRVAG